MDHEDQTDTKAQAVEERRERLRNKLRVIYNLVERAAKKGATFRASWDASGSEPGGSIGIDAETMKSILQLAFKGVDK